MKNGAPVMGATSAIWKASSTALDENRSVTEITAVTSGY